MMTEYMSMVKQTCGKLLESESIPSHLVRCSDLYRFGETLSHDSLAWPSRFIQSLQ